MTPSTASATRVPSDEGDHTRARITSTVYTPTMPDMPNPYESPNGPDGLNSYVGALVWEHLTSDAWENFIRNRHLPMYFTAGEINRDEINRRGHQHMDEVD